MKENKGFAQIIYAIWCVVLVSLAVFFFLAWQNHHRFKHPNVVIAKPALHVDEFPVEGWLLWQEEAVSSPVKGVLKFVNGGKVARVAKGEAIATRSGQVTTRGGWASARSKTAFIAPSTSSAPMPTSAPTSTKRPAWPI